VKTHAARRHAVDLNAYVGRMAVRHNLLPADGPEPRMWPRLYVACKLTVVASLAHQTSRSAAA
jgi:hypothetical protein